MRRTAELMADDYRKRGGYVRFVSLAAFPYVVTRDGRVTALLPIDALSWTRDTAVGSPRLAKSASAWRPRRVANCALPARPPPWQGALKAEGWTVLERQEAVRNGVAGEKRALL